LNGQTRHRNIIGLGKLDELATDDQKKHLGNRFEKIIKHRKGLLLKRSANDQVEKRPFIIFYELIKRKQRYDVKPNETEWETVNVAFHKKH
jgi:hypothetical protein